MYGTCMVRDAAAGHPSHPAIQQRGPGGLLVLRDPGGAAGWLGWPHSVYGPIWGRYGRIWAIYAIYACFCSPGSVFFEIFDPPEARYPSGGQRTCFFRDL